MLWPFRRTRKPAKPLHTARLELISITPALLAAEQQGPEAFATALQANIPADWPPEHWEPHVHTFITTQLTDHPETTGYHRYILLRHTPESSDMVILSNAKDPLSSNQPHPPSAHLQPSDIVILSSAKDLLSPNQPQPPGVPSSPTASSSVRVGNHESRPYPRTLVGCTGAFPKDAGDVELGYSTLPSHQRRGYATEAVTALVNWLFTHKRVASVSAQTYPTLPESIKVMERCGLTPAGPGDEPTTIRYRRAR